MRRLPLRGSCRPGFWVGMLGATLLIAACTASGAPPATPSSSPGSSASEAPGAGDLPPGCEPLNLRSPTGERVVLDGVWSTTTSTPPMTWWLHTEGECVWGGGQTDEVPIEGLSATPDRVQVLTGSIRSDFTIAGDIVWLGAPGAPGSRYAPLRMLIEFGDAGEVVLREDREAGVSGSRCPDPQSFCPAPIVLQRADRLN